jgi:hypothetical protein
MGSDVVDTEFEPRPNGTRRGAPSPVAAFERLKDKSQAAVISDLAPLCRAERI